jgi:hypothetical protein
VDRIAFDCQGCFRHGDPGGCSGRFDCPLIIAWLGFDSTHPLRHLIARIINCAPGEVKPGDTVQFVTFAVPSHPMDVKKETKICDRVYYAFEPVKK